MVVSLLNNAWDREPRQLETDVDGLFRLVTEFQDRTDIALTFQRNVRMLRAGRGFSADSRLGRALSEHGLEKAIEMERAFQKARLEAWVPASFDGPRKKANVRSVAALVLDFDDGVRFDQVWGIWKYARAAHTSWSHTHEKHKLRIVYPLKRPVPAGHWKKCWSFMYRRTIARGATADLKCKDPNRIYFLPAYRNESPHQARYSDGELLSLDWSLIPDLERRPGPQRAWVDRESTLHPDKRRDLADRLDADTDNERAFHILCPNCGRNEVFYFFEPHTMRGARCNHERTCGWQGRLEDLT